jgi:hypothetical protein
MGGRGNILGWVGEVNKALFLFVATKSSVPKLDTGESLFKSCGLYTTDDKGRTICFNDDPRRTNRAEVASIAIRQVTISAHWASYTSIDQAPAMTTEPSRSREIKPQLRSSSDW